MKRLISQCLPFSLAAVLAGAVAGQGVPILGDFNAYGPMCGASLAGADRIVDGRHVLSLHAANMEPGSPVGLAIGLDETVLRLPGSSCPLLVVPIIFVLSSADGAGRAEWMYRLPGAVQGRLFHQAIPFDPTTGRLASSNGQRVDFPGRMLITSVSPLSGKEGDLIVIRGSGFDPNPRNNCVWIDRITTAEVLTATPNELIARIQAVPAVGKGDVCVLRGTTVALPTGEMELGGLKVRVRTARYMRSLGQPAGAGERFVATEASPDTLAARLTPQGVALAVPTAPATKPETIEVHLLDDDGEWHDFTITIETTDVPLTPARGAYALAAYIDRHVPNVAAQASGSAFVLTPAEGIRDAVGYCQVGGR